MATSAVPRAIDALLAILRAAPDLEGVDIIDGPPVSDMSTRELVAVGWQPESFEGAAFVQDFASAGARNRDENLTITGWVDTWNGDRDMQVVRLRVFALLGVIEDAIRASGSQPMAPTLNGTVQWAHLTSGVLQQANTEQGVRAGIAFTVSGHARI
ncbi:hypothetical protein ACIOWI_29790 [Streptomyces sp. NPDC087659]|uniref:hypothetical protein n=1 Tax=Streptomyces sp. NPDC087659 TaxID=3365801 RepID=UPI00382681A1